MTGKLPVLVNMNSGIYDYCLLLKVSHETKRLNVAFLIQASDPKHFISRLCKNCLDKLLHWTFLAFEKGKE